MTADYGAAGKKQFTVAVAGKQIEARPGAGRGDLLDPRERGQRRPEQLRDLRLPVPHRRPAGVHLALSTTRQLSLPKPPAVTRRAVSFPGGAPFLSLWEILSGPLQGCHATRGVARSDGRARRRRRRRRAVGILTLGAVPATSPAQPRGSGPDAVGQWTQPFEENGVGHGQRLTSGPATGGGRLATGLSTAREPENAGPTLAVLSRRPGPRPRRQLESQAERPRSPSRPSSTGRRRRRADSQARVLGRCGRRHAPRLVRHARRPGRQRRRHVLRRPHRPARRQDPDRRRDRLVQRAVRPGPQPGRPGRRRPRRARGPAQRQPLRPHHQHLLSRPRR